MFVPKLVLDINGKTYELTNSDRLEIYNKEGYSVVRHNDRSEPLRHGEYINSQIDGESPIVISNDGGSMMVDIRDFGSSRFEGVEEKVSSGESRAIDIPRIGTREFKLIAQAQEDEIQIGINATWDNSDLSDIYDLGSGISGEKVTGDVKDLMDSIDGITEIEDGRGVMRKAYEVVDGSEIDLIGFKEGNVIKVALNQKGRKANRREFQAWQVVNQKPELRQYFCPLIHHGCSFKYVVMEYAEPFRNKRDVNIIDRFQNEIERNVDNDMIDAPVSQGLDIYEDNVGKYEGRIVLIDYPYGGKFLKEDEKGVEILRGAMNRIKE